MVRQSILRRVPKYGLRRLLPGFSSSRERESSRSAVHHGSTFRLPAGHTARLSYAAAVGWRVLAQAAQSTVPSATASHQLHFFAHRSGVRTASVPPGFACLCARSADRPSAIVFARQTSTADLHRSHSVPIQITMAVITTSISSAAPALAPAITLNDPRRTRRRPVFPRAHHRSPRR